MANLHKCNKCYLEKVAEDFPKSSRNLKTGLRKTCKACCNLLNKENRERNKELYSEARKKYYQANIEKMREEKRKYCAKRKDEKAIYDKTYRALKKERIAAYKKEWCRKNRHGNTEHKIKRNLRRRIHHVLKGESKSAPTLELVGCSFEFFMQHLESKFEPGMSWENYGKTGWHIDHIKPCYTFNLTDPEQQKACFHYSNQRPLWAKDNLSRRRPDFKHSRHATVHEQTFVEASR